MRRYSRVLIRLAATGAANGTSVAADAATVKAIADEIAAVAELGVELAVVSSAAHWFKSSQGLQWGVARDDADNLGNVASAFHALILKSVLRTRTERTVRVMTAQALWAETEGYTRLRAAHHLDNGYILLLADGTGDSTTAVDMALVQRAIDLKTRAVLVGVRAMDGLLPLEADAEGTAAAQQLSHADAIRLESRHLDPVALRAAQDANLTIHLFPLTRPQAMRNICAGQPVGTTIVTRA